MVNWAISLITRPFLHHFHHTFYFLAMIPNLQSINMSRCDDINQHGWFECMALNIWTMNNFVQVNDANGYEKFGHHIYVTICGGDYWPQVCKLELKD